MIRGQPCSTVIIRIIKTKDSWASSPMSDTDIAAKASAAQGARDSWLGVFLIFLRLGLTSFGGPVAHLGYFRAEFVERRKWLDEAHYLDIVALCQVLPGPASRPTRNTN